MRSLVHTSRRLIISRPKTRSSFRILYFRARFLSSSSGWIDESFDLPIGNNGSISLSLTRPVASNLPTQSHSRSQGPNVILYLRPGPLFQGHAYPVPEGDEPHDLSLDNLKWAANGTNHGGLSPQQSLASMTSATVVTVNYRLGAVSPPPRSNEETIQNSTHTSPNASPSSLSQPQSQPLFYKYPTPIHDTLAAFDWIKTNLNPAHLGVIGSHIGGSLALMLALTEAQSVKAVASIMPVTDWVGLDDYCTTEQANANTSEKPTSKRASKKKNLRATAPRDIVPLLAAREALFSSPERCFDAFASPILFLRSAGRDVPRAFPVYLARPEYPVPVLKNTRPADLDGSFSNQENDLEDDELNETGHTTVRRRKALSRWPPYGLDYGAGGRGWGGNGVRRLEVTLPWVRVYVEGNEGESSETVLADQGEEMVSVMRRACFFGREKGFGERRVSLVRGVGEVGLGVGEEVGGWFKGIFDGRIPDE